MTCLHCGEGNRHHNPAPTLETLGSTTTVKSWTALPLYSEAELPDDLDLIGGSNEKFQAWRIPVKAILPGGTMNPSTYSVPLNGATVEVPAGQVTPVFIPNSLASVEAAQANLGDHTAAALAFAKDENNLYIQTSGILKFARPHMYEVGKTYYLSQDKPGEVISVRPHAGIVQPLFTVIDQLTISVNISLY